MLRFSFLSILLLFFVQITFAQNVGIGTANPQHKLVVEGDRIHLKNPENNKFLYVRTDGSEIDITTVGSHFWITAEENKNIILNPNKSSSGNIGIGTYSPTEKLHIDGNVLVNTLKGQGNRLLYASPQGIIQSSTIDLQKLQDENQALKKEIAELKLRFDKLEAHLNK